MLWTDLDLTKFHARCRRRKRYRPLAEAGAGRLLRSPSLWEDLVKVLATTNISWSGTQAMTTRLVDAFGEQSPLGRSSFPRPESIARVTPDQLAERSGFGYRASSLRRIAELVSNDDLNLDAWEDPANSDRAIADQILSLPGVGPYAQACILALCGRFGQLPIDSVFRARHPDAEAALRHYRSWGALEISCLLVRTQVLEDDQQHHISDRHDYQCDRYAGPHVVVKAVVAGTHDEYVAGMGEGGCVAGRGAQRHRHDEHARIRAGAKGGVNCQRRHQDRGYVVVDKNGKERSQDQDDRQHDLPTGPAHQGPPSTWPGIRPAPVAVMASAIASMPPIKMIARQDTDVRASSIVTAPTKTIAPAAASATMATGAALVTIPITNRDQDCQRQRGPPAPEPHPGLLRNHDQVVGSPAQFVDGCGRSLDQQGVALL